MDHFHREKPSIYRYDTSFTFGKGKGHFYLDTGKKEQVLGLYYEWEGEDWVASQLSSLAQEMTGLPYGTLPSLKGERFPIALMLYRRFVVEIQESFIPWAKLKGRDPLNLLCRCFGVYKEDIHELVGSGVELHSLRDLGDHLQAGIGCGTCKEDLKEELAPLIPHPIESKEPVNDQSLWEKLDPQTLASEFHTLLRQFQGENNQYGVLKLGGTRPGSVLVSVEKSLGPEQRAELKERLKKECDKTLGPGLEIVFLSY
ncbi:MAG: (2Fe-2S)-binding protein [Bdellovibrionota bacterium]|nr:(2Fe-2S)-binding protein [Bdellovibrionota bacterium]